MATLTLTTKREAPHHSSHLDTPWYRFDMSLADARAAYAIILPHLKPWQKMIIEEDTTETREVTTKRVVVESP